MTKKIGGDKNTYPLDKDGKHVVDIVCRSHGHFIKMLKAMMKSIRNLESGDSNFDGYECNYIFVMGGEGEKAINKHVERINEERKKF